MRNSKSVEQTVLNSPDVARRGAATLAWSSSRRSSRMRRAVSGPVRTNASPSRLSLSTRSCSSSTARRSLSTAASASRSRSRVRVVVARLVATDEGRIVSAESASRLFVRGEGSLTLTAVVVVVDRRESVAIGAALGATRERDATSDAELLGMLPRVPRKRCTVSDRR